MTLGQRIREVRKKLNLDAKSFAKFFEMSQGNLSKIENGQQRASVEMLEIIYERWGVAPLWLLSGAGEMFADKNKGGDYESEPRYPFYTDVYAAAGDGYMNLSEYNIEEFSLKKHVSHQLGKGKIQCIRVNGDSMFPKYKEGDILFVDISNSLLHHEGIYVLNFSGTTLVKYVQRIPGGIRLHSLNSASYSDVDITEEQYSQDEVRIIGKVMGAVTF